MRRYPKGRAEALRPCVWWCWIPADIPSRSSGPMEPPSHVRRSPPPRPQVAWGWALAAGKFPAVRRIFPRGIVPVAGGVLIRDERGTLLGAVGISGDTSDNDEICAIAGIRAAGLVADSGAT
jgi:Haem-degrading